MSSFLRHGRSARQRGLLTQAPPNTGSGWYSLATGAWPGVHGSTNNTFHINGQPFANRTSAFDANVLQAESIAQAAERGGSRSPRSSGRAAATARSTVRRSTSARSSPAGAWRRTSSASLVTSSSTTRRSSVRSGSSSTRRRVCRTGAFPAAAPTAASGWTGALPATFSPPKEMRLRVLDFGVDKYGLVPGSSTARTTATRTTTGCSSRARRARRTPSPSCARASGPTSRSRSRAAR